MDYVTPPDHLKEPLNQVLNQYTLKQLRPWAAAGNLPSHKYGKKATVIQELLASPSSIPRYVLDRASRSTDNVSAPTSGVNAAQDQLAGFQDQIGQSANTALSQESISSIIDQVAPRIEKVFKRLEDRLKSLEDRLPVQPSEAQNLATARQFYGEDDQILILVLENNLKMKDIWKLDPSPVQGASDGLTLGSLYPTVAAIIRPWLVFCQLRDVVDSGVGIFMTRHAVHLLSLSKDYPNRWDQILSYHMHIAEDRVPKGTTLDRKEWLSIDTGLFNRLNRYGPVALGIETSP